MSANNARKEKARRLMALRPDLTYQQAWELAGPLTEEKLEQLVAEMREKADLWEAQLDELTMAGNAAAERAASTSRFHDHVSARFDGDGQLVDLNIAAPIMGDGRLAEIVTEVLQRTWDASQAAVRAVWAEQGMVTADAPTAPRMSGVYSEASHDGTLKLAVDGAGRLLWCEIGDRVVADEWRIAELSSRIVVLYQVAWMRSARDAVGRSDAGCGEGMLPTDADIAAHRARLLTF